MQRNDETVIRHLAEICSVYKVCEKTSTVVLPCSLIIETGTSCSTEILVIKRQR